VAISIAGERGKATASPAARCSQSRHYEFHICRRMQRMLQCVCVFGTRISRKEPNAPSDREIGVPIPSLTIRVRIYRVLLHEAVSWNVWP